MALQFQPNLIFNIIYYLGSFTVKLNLTELIYSSEATELSENWCSSPFSFISHPSNTPRDKGLGPLCFLMLIELAVKDSEERCKNIYDLTFCNSHLPARRMALNTSPGSMVLSPTHTKILAQMMLASDSLSSLPPAITTVDRHTLHVVKVGWLLKPSQRGHLTWDEPNTNKK